MTTEEKELYSHLAQKLDVLAALLLRLIPKNIESLSLKEQVKLLDGLGVRPVEIAKIIGKTPGHVSKELVGIRKMK